MRIVGLGWRFGFLGSSYERDCYWTAPLNNCFHKNILLNPYQLPVRRFPLRCVGLMLRDPRRWFGCGDSSAARLFALKLRCKRLMHCTVYIQICIYIYMYSIYVPGSGSPPHPPCHGHGHNSSTPLPPCGMGGPWEGVGVIQPVTNSNVTGRIRWRKLISGETSMYAEISYKDVT